MKYFWTLNLLINNCLLTLILFLCITFNFYLGIITCLMVTDVVVVLEDLLSVVVLGLLLYLFQAFPKNKIRN